MDIYGNNLSAVLCNDNEKKRRRGGIAGSSVKIIALIVMVLDHIAWILIDTRLDAIGFPSFPSIAPVYNIEACLPEYVLSYLFHIIGRMAFPLFLFLLTEGVRHTENDAGELRRYAVSLLIFAFVSELPFDLFTSGAVDMRSQNVFFTLLLSLIAVYSIRKIKTKTWLRILCIAASFAAAFLIRCDYGAWGVLLACAIELFRENKKAFGVIGWAAFIAFKPYEIPILLSLPVMKMYNGERGLKLRYFFYAFYPVHLLVLYVIYLII